MKCYSCNKRTDQKRDLKCSFCKRNVHGNCLDKRFNLEDIKDSREIINDSCFHFICNYCTGYDPNESIEVNEQNEQLKREYYQKIFNKDSNESAPISHSNIIWTPSTDCYSNVETSATNSWISQVEYESTLESSSNTQNA